MEGFGYPTIFLSLLFSSSKSSNWEDTTPHFEREVVDPADEYLKRSQAVIVDKAFAIKVDQFMNLI